MAKLPELLKALEELGLAAKTMNLSARKTEDREMIAQLPSLGAIGTVLIDDFHRLDSPTKQIVADYMKTLADEESPDSKLVVVGINKPGDSLVKFAADLNNRIDTINLETNSEERIGELVAKGEVALNISLNTKQQIIADSHGSFHIAQMLCREICLSADILERQEKERIVAVSLEVVRERVLDELARVFFEPARIFATGPKLRRAGRAPYLHMLNWLAQQNEWSLQLDQALSQHPEHRGSVGQVVDKQYLENFMRLKPELADVIHYDPITRALSVEDPKFISYLRNLIWNKFSKQVGYISTNFKGRYDFALSFAGSDRDIAEKIDEALTEAEFEVFYDKNEQHRILASNVEEYLAPIYRTEAEFVIVLLGKEYPKRIWTNFESEHFKQRFGDKSVIPSGLPTRHRGCLTEAHRTLSTDVQILAICKVIIRKLAESRVDATDEPLDGEPQGSSG